MQALALSVAAGLGATYVYLHASGRRNAEAHGAAARAVQPVDAAVAAMGDPRRAARQLVDSMPQPVPSVMPSDDLLGHKKLPMRYLSGAQGHRSNGRRAMPNEMEWDAISGQKVVDYAMAWWQRDDDQYDPRGPYVYTPGRPSHAYAIGAGAIRNPRALTVSAQ